jgi:LuxR family maltose regulon positive regulatory protein
MFAPFLEHAPASRNDLEALLESSVEGANDRIADFVAELRALLSGSYGGTHAISRLSEREREVLGALCNRESNKFIARRLGVSENAVKFHVKNIFRKLGVHSRREAVESAFLQS